MVWLRCPNAHRWASGMYQGRVVERDRCPFCDGEGRVFDPRDEQVDDPWPDEEEVRAA